MAVVLTRPQVGTLAFVFENIWTPEGILRISLWRYLAVNDRDLFFSPGTALPDQPNFSQLDYIRLRSATMYLNNRLVVSNPETEEKIEKYFSQNAYSAFAIGLYDSNDTNDILRCKTQYPPKLKEDVDERIFTKYIYRKDDDGNPPEVYCSVEFLQDGFTEYDLVALGEMNDSVKGVDQNWYHTDYANPYLSTGNKEYDADRIWTLQFSSIAMTALGKIPVKPVTDATDDSNYYMPFYDPILSPTKHPFAPIDSRVPVDGPVVIQGVSDVTYTTTPPEQEKRALWKRHISAGYWIRLVLDYAFGANTAAETNYIFESALSPMRFQWGKIQNGTLQKIFLPFQNKWIVRDGSPTIDPASILRRVRPHMDASLPEWLLIPQCIFGLYDDITPQVVVPVPQKHWANTFESIWEAFLELCFMLGLIPLYDTILVNGKRTPRVRFLEKGVALPNTFTTIVGESAEPEIMPETESGIEIKRRETFKNAEEKAGDFRDFFATRAGVKAGSISVMKKKPEVQPYVMPPTAQSPAKLELSLVMGGDLTFYDTGNVTEAIDWYAVSMPNRETILEPASTNGEAFPMFSPLILADTDFPLIEYDLPPLPFALQTFAPIVRGWPGDPTDPDIPLCDSFSSLVANFNAPFYRRSALKYNVTYPTITQFTNTTKSHEYFRKKRWDAIQLLFQTPLFNDVLYVHSVKRSWNTMKTTVEYFSTGLKLTKFTDRDRDINGGGVPEDENTDTPEDPRIIGDVTTGKSTGVSLVEIVPGKPEEISYASVTIDGGDEEFIAADGAKRFFAELTFDDGAHDIDFTVYHFNGNSATTSLSILSGEANEMWVGGTNGNATYAANTFFPLQRVIGQAGTVTVATDPLVADEIDRDIAILSFTVKLDAPPVIGAGDTFAIFKNGIMTAFSVTIPNGQVRGTITGSLACEDGDEVCVKCVAQNGTGVSATWTTGVKI